MAHGKPRRIGVNAKIIWLGGAVIAAVVIALVIDFAVTRTNGASGPSDVPPGSSQSHSSVLVSDDCGGTNDEGLFEPGTITLACGDGTIVANSMKWSQWGTATATGQGYVNQVSCVPNCAEGKDVAYPAKLTLSEPVKAGNSKEYFTRVEVSFLAPGPGGSSSELFKDCFDAPIAPYQPTCPADERGAN